jgi:hypothetical protein
MKPAPARSLICRQLDFRHSEPIDADGVGTGLDLAVEAYQTRSCASTTHGNPPADADCARGELLGLKNRNLVADSPRPGFGDLPFCQSCHTTSNDPVPGLRPAALLPGTVAARDDPRRQPLSWPALQSGGLPEIDGQLVLPFHSGWLSRELDELLLGDSPTEGPRKIEPQP